MKFKKYCQILLICGLMIALTITTAFAEGTPKMGVAGKGEIAQKREEFFSSSDGEIKEYPVGAFDQIDLEGIGEVYFLPGEEYSVQVQIAQKLKESTQVKVEVKEGELKLATLSTNKGWGSIAGLEGKLDQLDEGLAALDESLAGKSPTEDLGKITSGLTDLAMEFGNNSGVKYFITSPAPIKKVEMEGVNYFYGDKLLPTSNFKIEIEGAGYFGGVVESDEVKVEMDGTGRVVLRGKGKKVLIEIGGAGNFDGRDFEVEKGEVEIDGTGNVQIHAVKELLIKADGIGNIEYKGDPVITKKIDGMVNIQKIQ